MTNMTDIEPMTVLLKRRTELRERLTRIEDNLKRGLHRDSEEQAIQLENMDVLLEIERVTAEELFELEREINQAEFLD